MLTGILDVSHHNGKIDWQAVADGGGVAMIAKASQGKTNRDPRFVENWQGAKAAGMIPGAYHFFNGTEVPAKEAANFLAAVREVWQPEEPGLFALDLEWPSLDPMPSPPRPPEYFTRASEFVRIVQDDLKRPEIIYTQASFWKACGNPKGFERQPSWLARHTRDPKAEPPVPPNMRNWSFWQYTGHETVPGEWPGVTGNIDLNRFNGSLDDLWALADNGLKPAPKPKPETPPADETVASKRETVRSVQRACQAAGIDPGPIDGIIGPLTKAAVVRLLDLVDDAGL